MGIEAIVGRVSDDETPYGFAAKNNVYTNLQYDNLNPLDRIARFIVAIVISGVYASINPLKCKEQFFVGQRTVAVALSGTRLYIAANNVWTDSSEGYGKNKFVEMHEDQKSIVRNFVVAEFNGMLESKDKSTAPIVPKFDYMQWLDSPEGGVDTSLHAEMQLVRYFRQHHLSFEGQMIGVSKPCCLQCAKVLDNLEIQYSYFHQVGVGYWIAP